jgi:RNA polymerase sigma factor (sigma-70 family)
VSIIRDLPNTTLREYNGGTSPNMEGRSPIPDAELVRGLRAGEHSAGEELFEKYSRRVYYLALRELRSNADAEEVRAETFLRVLKAIQANQLRSPDALSAFVLGTARNVIMETLRSPLRSADDRIPDVAAPQTDAFLDGNVREAIEATLRRLKPREREFLRLQYYEELEPDEIARRIGVTLERLRLVKSRTFKSFREMYARLSKIADTKGGVPSLKI